MLKVSASAEIKLLLLHLDHRNYIYAYTYTMAHLTANYGVWHVEDTEQDPLILILYQDEKGIRAK